MMIVKGFEGRLKQRGINFTFESAKDEGIYDAIKRGFEKFEIGPKDWMCWINSDDQLTGLFSYTLLNVENTVEIITGMPAIRGKTGKLIKLNRFYSTRLINSGFCNGSDWYFIQQEGTAWRKSLYDKAKLSDILSRYKLAGDYFLWRSISNYSEFYQCTYPLGIFNIVDLQKSQLENDKYQRELGSGRSGEFLARNDMINLINYDKKYLSYDRRALKVKDRKLFEVGVFND